ncbi:uncharacterized protein LOC116323117 [Oreochromis aureus]|uniref:uncharacterized protein LOC116323117 n=1 Tax=Oreochromis aureus TaxID=47969 RepID=UPI001952D2FC|nr:uncharacterized protein LOC116323117 [Oreochromis aureus]
MDALKFYFTLLLPLTACSQDLGGDAVVKTIGKQPDVTQICTNGAQTIITLIVCTIRTQRSRGENCSLLYEYARGFENKCDSRFTLMKENQTVFLHLINLTSQDSGSYTCQCTTIDGTKILHLNVTVDGKQELSSRSGTETVPLTLICVTVFIIVSLVIFGFIHARLRQSCCSRSEISGLSVNENHGSLDEDVQDDSYTNLQHPTNDVYQTITSDHPQHHITTN